MRIDTLDNLELEAEQTFVCPECFTDEEWQEKIRVMAEWDIPCSYCEFYHGEITCLLSELRHVVLEEVLQHYQPTTDDEQAVTDTYDLIYDKFADIAGVNNPALLADLYSSIRETSWKSCSEIEDEDENDVKNTLFDSVQKQINSPSGVCIF